MEEQAAASRQMLRALLTPASNEEDARAYLQTRLTVYSKLMFWSFVVLLAFLGALYVGYPDKKPHNNTWIFGGAMIGLATMAFIWRVLLVRRKLSVEQLYRIDLVYGVGIGTAFGASAFFSPDLAPAAYTSLIFACFAVFTRALVVPSSRARTAFVSVLAFIPVTISGIGLALTDALVVHDLPAPAFVAGDLVISSVVVLIATTGSRVIYDLNRAVSDAMQLGQYTLGRKIGEGGMGVVYRAQHVLLRRPTAIKLLHPDRVGADNLDRFAREVQHMSELTHPNTVAVYDYGRSAAGVFYYAMEYLGDGITLEDLVRRYGAQPVGRVAAILVQVCGALREAHDSDLIHRDIKPANIILCQRGGMPDVAKVVDFGLVKNFATDTSASTDVIVGTAAYLAPEAIVPGEVIGPPVDLYALGAVGYFLLTGRRVFDGKTHVSICVQHMTATPAWPTDVAIPAELGALVLQCLAKKPEDRPASAAALAEALRALPIATDWSETEARRWWQGYQAVDEVALSATPTLTMPVDLGHRA